MSAMRPDVVVDIGNTRIKWGLVGAPGAADEILRVASLGDDVGTWRATLDEWQKDSRPPQGHRPWTWVLASVQPRRLEALTLWLRGAGQHVVALGKAAQLPLVVKLERPDYAGIDRLLNGVAARRHLAPGRPAVLIDAGSAVTVDWLDESHAFCGGSIYPGLDLMAKALNDYTALLPRVTVTNPVPALPAGDTVSAMQVGLFLAVSGGIREAVRLYSQSARVPPRVFFSGGQAPLLARGMGVDQPGGGEGVWGDCLVWPEQTLIGIVDSAERLSP